MRKSELTAGDRDATVVKDTLLGVGPFGVVVPLGVICPALLPLALGVEGVRGPMRGCVVDELVGVRRGCVEEDWVGVRGAMRAWGVEGALGLSDVGV